MSNIDIWYGFLEAGAKSSPVVRDMSLEDKGRSTIYLYNYVRGTFVEYSLKVVESKLRKLQPEDISLKELDSAFESARKTFNPVKVVKKWSDAAPAVTTDESDDADILPDLDNPIDDMDVEDDN